jgi:hypothetical protein
MINFLITPDLRIGYAYDRVVSSLKFKTSHEVMILYDLFTPKKVSSFQGFF